METEQFQQPQKSRRPLLLVIAAVVVIVLAAGGAYVAFTMMNKPEVKQTVASPSPTPQVTLATKEQVSENLSTLSDSVKQMAADQAAAKAAMNDAKAQIKAND